MWSGVGFGTFLLLSFGPMFGGAGSPFIGTLYTILVFPLHLFGFLFILVTGKPIGEIRFGLLVLLFTLPLTYGLIGWGIGRLVSRTRGRKWI